MLVGVTEWGWLSCSWCLLLVLARSQGSVLVPLWKQVTASVSGG